MEEWDPRQGGWGWGGDGAEGWGVEEDEALTFMGMFQAM